MLPGKTKETMIRLTGMARGGPLLVLAHQWMHSSRSSCHFSDNSLVIVIMNTGVSNRRRITTWRKIYKQLRLQTGRIILLYALAIFALNERELSRGSKGGQRQATCYAVDAVPTASSAVFLQELRRQIGPDFDITPDWQVYFPLLRVSIVF